MLILFIMLRKTGVSTGINFPFSEVPSLMSITISNFNDRGMRQLFIIFSFFFLSACKEPYVSPYNTPNLGYLVVEGVINSGPGNTTIKLSRTSPLTDGTYVVETGASVMVMDQNNRAYPLSETVAGQYTADGLNLDPGLKCRLQVDAAGKEYLSDYVAVNDKPTSD